ncbi:hypothetical protein SELMODRAFT_413137 [Selaginella moellendorffii]|uniref:Uncharacterized protein n=1 Tax=Selaginella moellendorffii TaxID=88036 RepID=D8RNG8_SELML|nr:hypothetical protein SELMODRAFT_413137 [Selaginella moellendorffii]
MELRRVMDLDGSKPDELSFVSLLLGCSSRDTARRCLWLMIRDYHIAPIKLHYGCMADLFHRCGYRRKNDIEPFKASIPDESSDWVERILEAERSMEITIFHNSTPNT